MLSGGSSPTPATAGAPLPIFLGSLQRRVLHGKFVCLAGEDTGTRGGLRLDHAPAGAGTEMELPTPPRQVLECEGPGRWSARGESQPVSARIEPREPRRELIDAEVSGRGEVRCPGV